METDWAENRADIPQGFIRNILEKISTRLYSAATRDKFRVRLERGIEPGTTELYLSHRGAEEVAQGEGFGLAAKTIRPGARSRDVEPDCWCILVSIVKTQRRYWRSRLRKKNAPTWSGPMTGLPPWPWMKIFRVRGVAPVWPLDRVGFTVEDRDRSRGLYFVRYIDPLKDVGAEEEEGWLSKLKFWGEDDEADPSRDAYLSQLDW